MERASGQDPTAVALRREVNFCCPVPECSNVILTYHHFDPPWRERQHNDPHGMIALCPVCHGLAEGGRWTKEQIRDFKRNPKPPGSVRHRFGFPEPGRKAIYKLGGNYVFACPQILSVAGITVFWEGRSAEGDILFNLLVLDERNRTVLVIIENSLSADSLALWDCFIGTRGDRLLVRTKKGRVALELRMRHITTDDLRHDLEAISSASALPCEILDKMKAVWPAASSEPGQRLPVSSAGEPIRAELINDLIRQVDAECKNSDGRLLVVDVARANLHANGRWFYVRDGAVGGHSVKNCVMACNAGGFAFPGIRLIEKLWPKIRDTFTLQDALLVQREKVLLEGAKQPDPLVEATYAQAVSKFPALMQTAAGLFAFRVGQNNPGFLL